MSKVTVIEVGVTDFRASLSDYLAQAGAGATVIIKSHGKQVARLMPPETRFAGIPFDFMKGDIRIGDDFDDELPTDVLDAMSESAV